MWKNVSVNSEYAHSGSGKDGILLVLQMIVVVALMLIVLILPRIIESVRDFGESDNKGYDKGIYIHSEIK